MKKLLLILLCLPFIGFGQDNKKVELGFNFNKSNNYNNKTITNKYYNNPSKYNFNKPIKNHKDSSSNYISYYQDKTSYSPFNKGLIHLLHKAMQQGVENNPSILKKPNMEEDANEIN